VPPPTSRSLRQYLLFPRSVTANRCVKCSLAPICLPEEARLAADPKWRAIRLLPMHARGVPLHVRESGSHVGRSGETLSVTHRDGGTETFPIGDLAGVVLHGHAQITTQAIRLALIAKSASIW
jgi:CRISP-associated protein Cas1